MSRLGYGSYNVEFSEKAVWKQPTVLEEFFEWLELEL